MDYKDSLAAQVSTLREKLREWKKIQTEKEQRKMSDEKEQSTDKKFSIWSEYSAEDKLAMKNLAADYIDFISRCKTERESVAEAVKQARAAGYKNLDDVIKNKVWLKAGDKVYSVCMKKTVALFQIGTEPLEKGLKILGAHVDTCRLDLKQIRFTKTAGLLILIRITTAA
jgi:Aspartyl aminopeptidase